ncbi:MAG: NADH-quinone oxidoreductase subunit NuoN [Rhodospirillaceae bacterium]|nr:NADH-quinone oxidoreductase subunit NuoN [Rhodospirillaceae bacterium]|tara:strand:- start:376 stop:1818 length:1443 start_codon:yes stop_codon:yes gene_type:complete
MNISLDVLQLRPEILLTAGLLILLVFGAFRDKAGEPLVTRLMIALLAIVAILVVVRDSEKVKLFSELLILDAYGRFAQTLIIVSVIMTLLVSVAYRKTSNLIQNEYPILIGFSALGMLLMVLATDLMALYLAVELQSLSLYALAAFDRNSERSSEAGLKFFVLGALSSGILLYGCSFIYGAVGSTSFELIAAAAAIPGAELSPLLFGLVLVCCGLAFKVSAVPFHMWTPDVYEGSPTPITMFFSVGPKIAALSLLTRLLLEAFPDAIHQWQQIIWFLAIASMVLGSLLAVLQNNIKRLMAYSTIAHVGYVLMGIGLGSEFAISSVLIYLAVYLVLVIGTFGCILAAKVNNFHLEQISDLSGIGRNQPIFSLAFAIMLLGLAGIPPMAGFFAKFYLFISILQAEMYWLVLIAALSTIIGAYYYLRIIKVMYFDESKQELDQLSNPELNIIIGTAAVFTLFFFVNHSIIVDHAGRAAGSLFN